MTILRPPPNKAPFVPTPSPPSGGGGIFVPNTGASGGGIPIMAGQFIPPNGFAGFAQQTSAVQSLFRSRRGGGSKRRRKSTATAAPRRKKKRAAARGGKARLVKGSAAAKRYMAKIRKMRK